MRFCFFNRQVVSVDNPIDPQGFVAHKKHLKNVREFAHVPARYPTLYHDVNCRIRKFFAHGGIYLVVNVVTVIRRLMMRLVIGLVLAAFDGKLSRPFSSGKKFPPRRHKNGLEIFQ